MHLSNGEAMTDSFPFWIRVKDESPNSLRLVYALRADPNNPYRLIVTAPLHRDIDIGVLRSQSRKRDLLLWTPLAILIKLEGDSRLKGFFFDEESPPIEMPANFSQQELEQHLAVTLPAIFKWAESLVLVSA